MPLDLTPMSAMHDVLRRELEDIARLTARVNDDPRLILRDTTAWRLFKRRLRAHQSAEDKMLWPALRRRLVDRPGDMVVLEAIEAEHAAIEQLVAAIDESVASPVTSSVHLGSLADSALTGLRGHFEHEEEAVFPLIRQAFRESEWAAFERVHSTRIGALSGAHGPVAHGAATHSDPSTKASATPELMLSRERETMTIKQPTSTGPIPLDGNALAATGAPGLGHAVSHASRQVDAEREDEPLSIETERLRLRVLTAGQAELVVAGDSAGQPWSPGYPRDDDRDVARMALAHPAAEPEFGPLQIIENVTGLVVGGLGFFGPPDDEGTVEFGYGVVPEVEGRGYATEALRGLLQYAFGTGRVRRAIADTTHENVASQRVMEKAGLHRVGADERLYYYAIAAVVQTTPGQADQQ